jgi:hypothetical protein
MGFDMVILTPYKVNGSFLPNDRLHKNSYTLASLAATVSDMAGRGHLLSRLNLMSISYCDLERLTRFR